MAYENIRFKKPNMTVVNGYFYYFDEDRNVLFEKIDDGDTSFTYPLNTSINTAVISLEHDGIYFWTMQDDGGTGVDIKRWELTRSIVRLRESFNFTPNFDSNAFTVEHYHTSLSSTISGGDSIIDVNKYYDSTIVSGSILTLGPNTSNQFEDVEVTLVSGSSLTLSSGIQYDYNSGDDVNFYNNLWIFNNFGAGALHKINARTGSIITTYNGSQYDNVTACTFANVDGPNQDSSVDTLAYAINNSTSLRFLNIDTQTNYGIALMDNVRTNGITIIPIYDLAIYGDNVYRLQDEGTYYGTNNDWGTQYNYQTTPLRSFINSITVTAFPAILPANGVNIAEARANVLDQYGRGAVYRPVYWTDDDNYGYITVNPTYTDLFFGTGNTNSYYRAGVQVRTVTIQGRVTQYD